MRDDLIRDLFPYIGEKSGFTVGHAPREVEQRLEELPVTLHVKRLLQWRWPTSLVRVGPYTLDSAEAILANDDLEKLLAAKMVLVGSARNGDLLVVFFPNEDRTEVGLVSHDQLWDDELPPHQAYIQVTGTVKEYLLRVAEGRFLPVDSCLAGELESLKAILRAKFRPLIR
jgi:hypothetical protein